MEYSFSFDPQLEQEWQWTEKYPTQPEILRYANHVADRFDLRRDIRFGTRVTHTVFDEDAGRWTVRTDRGEQLSAQFVVHASGCLSASRTPEVPGLEITPTRIRTSEQEYEFDTIVFATGFDAAGVHALHRRGGELPCGVRRRGRQGVRGLRARRVRRRPSPDRVPPVADPIRA